MISYVERKNKFWSPDIFIVNQSGRDFGAYDFPPILPLYGRNPKIDEKFSMGTNVEENLSSVDKTRPWTKTIVVHDFLNWREILINSLPNLLKKNLSAKIYRISMMKCSLGLKSPNRNNPTIVSPGISGESKKSGYSLRKSGSHFLPHVFLGIQKNWG